MFHLSSERRMRPTFISLLLVSLFLCAGHSAKAQTINASSNAPTNPGTSTSYTFAAHFSDEPYGSKWVGYSFDFGNQDPNTGNIVWESYYHGEMNATIYAFDATATLSFLESGTWWVRATGYTMNSDGSVQEIHSNLLGPYYP